MPLQQENFKSQSESEEAEIRTERSIEKVSKPERLPETPEALDELRSSTRDGVAITAQEAIASGDERIGMAVESIGGGSEDIEAGKVTIASVQERIEALASETQEKIGTPQTAEIIGEAEAPPLPEDQAREKWKELSPEQKLTYCDPAVVRQEMEESLALAKELAVEGFGEQENFSENVEKVQKNVEVMIDGYVEAGHISQEYGQKIANCVKEYVGLTQQAQQEGSLSTELKATHVNDLAKDVVEKMVYQTKESLKRALGDHGVRHIIDGNITEAMKIVEEYNRANPNKPLTAFDKMKIMTVHFNHDMGYTVGINRVDFKSNSEHGTFSKKIFDSDQELYGKIFAEEDMAQMSEIIRTHDHKETDFDEKPLESTVRLSDNLGLFYDSKLPEIFYESPENLVTLQKIYIAREAGQDISGLQQQLKEQIERQPDLDDNTRRALLNAATEINKTTPEFNLGMFAGKLEGYRMNGKQMVVQLRESDMHKQIQELFDLGQRQFVKLLDSYGLDLKKMEQKLEDVVQVDEQGTRYIDLPPTGEGEKPLRFEFRSEDPSAEEAPRNREIKEKFIETEIKWERINIRKEINNFVSQLENRESRTEEKVSELSEELTFLVSDKISPEDLEKIELVLEKLKADIKDDTAFKNDLTEFKKFLTQGEKDFLAVQ